jgi:hypothetical protein
LESKYYGISLNEKLGVVNTSFDSIYPDSFEWIGKIAVDGLTMDWFRLEVFISLSF